MAGTPNGTSDTLAGCAPYYPVVAQGTGFICTPTLVQGVRVDGKDPGVCTYNGFAFRPVATGQGECIEQGAVIPGDLVWAGGQPNAQDVGTSICGAQNLTATTVTPAGANGGYWACAGTRATAVSDAKAQAKLDTIAGNVLQVKDSVADGSAAVEGAVKSAASEGTATSYTAPDFGTSTALQLQGQMGTIAIAFLLLVLAALGIVRGVGFVRKLAR